jgi:putative hydrolase of the HAD superfamily
MSTSQPFALLVDFGEVISRPQPEGIVAAMASVAGVELPLFRERYWAHRPGYDRGTTASEFWSAVAGREIGEDGRLQQLIELDNESWSDINHDTLAVLADARARGHSLSLLSNAPREFAEAMRNSPVLADFDHVIFSASIGAIKPDRAVFDASVEQVGRPAHEILFIDDRAANVRGAIDAGLRAVQFTSAAQLRADLGS